MSHQMRKWGGLTLFVFLLTTLFILGGCSGQKASTVTNDNNTTSSPPQSNTSETNESAFENKEASSMSDVVTYETHVKDLIASNCLACHGSDAPTMDEFSKDPDKYSAMMRGPRYDSYENLLVVVNGSEAGALMRRLDDGTNKEDGQPGNMYQNLGASDEERQKNLAMLKQWVGHWTLKHADELTDEDRAKFTVYKNNEDAEAHGSAALTSENVTYETHVKDLIASNCLACHGSDAPTMDEFSKDPDKYTAMMRGPRYDSYENLLVVVNGSEAGALMRRLDDGTNKEDGQPGNMYQNLGASDEERQKNLAMLKQWVGHWTLKHADELTDEDRAKFNVPEK